MGEVVRTTFSRFRRLVMFSMKLSQSCGAA